MRVRTALVERSTGEILIGPPKSKAGRRIVGIPGRHHPGLARAPGFGRQSKAWRPGLRRRQGRAAAAEQHHQLDVGPDARRPSGLVAVADWGAWTLDPGIPVLVCEPEHYEIALDDCRTATAILDWIAQIAGKGWGRENAVLAGLVRAFDDILNLQANVCPHRSASEPLSREQVRKLAHKAAADRAEGFRIYPELAAEPA